MASKRKQLSDLMDPPPPQFPQQQRPMPGMMPGMPGMAAGAPNPGGAPPIPGLQPGVPATPRFKKRKK